MNIIFTLNNDYIELNKLLKVTGLCATGGMAKIVIDEGLVRVDGNVEHRKRCKIRKGQKIVFEDNTIELE